MLSGNNGKAPPGRGAWLGPRRQFMVSRRKAANEAGDHTEDFEHPFGSDQRMVQVLGVGIWFWHARLDGERTNTTIVIERALIVNRRCSEVYAAAEFVAAADASRTPSAFG